MRKSTGPGLLGGRTDTGDISPSRLTGNGSGERRAELERGSGPNSQKRRTAPIRRLSILGATGSVGTSTLQLVDHTRDVFEIVALTANTNVEKLAQLAIKYKAELAVIADERQYGELRALLSETGIEAAAGPSGLIEAALRPADCIMAAIMGAAGLQPTLAAISQGSRLALANKECLVCAGDLFMQAVATAGTELLPVDSEHSAAFQALQGAQSCEISRITLTASGGPFRTSTLDELRAATPEQALKHPNWSMGRKITIDSATMMNKGLELIEAYHLFPVRIDQLDVVIHPQSIVHCLVDYIDGSVLAQLASPDMCTPIAYSLSWPARMSSPTASLDLVKIGALTFEAPDYAHFPALRVAKEALQRGGAAPLVLNAANEIAVDAFLCKKLGFLEIAQLVADMLEQADRRNMLSAPAELDQVLALDSEIRQLARGLLGQYG